MVAHIFLLSSYCSMHYSASGCDLLIFGVSNITTYDGQSKQSQLSEGQSSDRNYPGVLFRVLLFPPQIHSVSDLYYKSKHIIHTIQEIWLNRLWTVLNTNFLTLTRILSDLCTVCFFMFRIVLLIWWSPEEIVTIYRNFRQ